MITTDYMRIRLFFFFVCLLCELLVPQRMAAQVVYISDPNAGVVKLKVVEEKTGKPIPYATVYVTAKNDTLITNFALTDTLGVAQLKKVTRGTYNVNVELLGYKSWQKEHYFGFSWQKREYDLGTVALAEDVEMLESARISAIGNPIEIKQDTVIFNAASFQLGQNAMLEDLLKRMPGMEVSESGTIKYNGETIPRITVGGKTFFSDDPSMALKNLPAKIIDKVKVIDKKSDAEAFTGVAAEREKVMDLEFKQEFKQGWFGNVEAGAGSTLAGDRAAELIDNRGLIYNFNGLVSGYTEKDQLTVVGKAYNAPGGDGSVVVFFADRGEEPTSLGGGGLETRAQAGANLNTTRIKGLESTVSANYNHSFSDSRNQAIRTTSVTEGADIRSDSENKTFTLNNTVRADIELKNIDRKKYLFNFRPRFSYNQGTGEAYNDDSSQEAGGGFLNSSASSTFRRSGNFQHSAGISFGLRNLGGKKSRSLTFDGTWSLSDYDAGSREYSETRLRGADTPVVKDLFYDTNNRSVGGSLSIQWVEPLSDRWKLSTSVRGSYTGRNNEKDAFSRTAGVAHFDASLLDQEDYRTPNSYYSTASKTRYVNFRQNIQFQWEKSPTSVQLGADLQETLNEVTSLSRGVTTQSGIGEWLFNWSPYMQLRWRKGSQANYSTYLSGRSSMPSSLDQLPELDISVPTRLRLGNIYLQPSYRTNLSFNAALSNAEKQRSFMGNASVAVNSRSRVTASWFDPSGIAYSIPVNAVKPALTASLIFTLNTPISSDKRFSTTLSLFSNYGRSVSYQNVRRIEALNLDTFDYAAFMSAFWGADSRGETFYSGASGFSESVTRTLDLNPSLSLRYRADNITVYVSGGTTMNASHYSLDNSADTRTWSSSVSGRFNWTTKHEFEIGTDASYHFYAGFPEGFNKPYLRWNFELSKNIKAWALSFRIDDILNHARSTRHITTANYVEDSMQNMLGRRFIFSVKWNFGKLNAAKGRKADNFKYQLLR